MDSESARFRFLISRVGAVRRIVIVGLFLLVALGGWVSWQSFSEPRLSEPRRIVSQVIYLDVLDQERRLFRAELDLASTTRDQLTAVVQVYQALGGGWETSRAIDKGEGE